MPRVRTITSQILPLANLSDVGGPKGGPNGALANSFVDAPTPWYISNGPSTDTVSIVAANYRTVCVARREEAARIVAAVNMVDGAYRKKRTES